MASDLLDYLVEERMAAVREEMAAARQKYEADFKARLATYEQERLAERAAREQERLAEQRLAVEQALERAVEDVVLARFPATPIASLVAVKEVSDPFTLQELIRALLKAPDQEAAEQLLRQVR